MLNVFHLEITCVQRDTRGEILHIGIDSPASHPTVLTLDFARELKSNGHHFYVRTGEQQSMTEVSLSTTQIQIQETGTDVPYDELPSCT